MKAEGIPAEERIFGRGYNLRPSFVQPYACKNVLIEGITIKRPPMWMIHPVLSGNITIRNVKIIDCQFNNIKHENVLEFVNGLELERLSLNGQVISSK